jgi:arylsulfatase A-like enzyme
LADDLTRRDAIRAGGVGAAGLALFGAGCNSDGEAAGHSGEARLGVAPAGALNVVVVVMDSLRADHIYGSRAQTPTFNKFATEALRFSRAFPEGMPTIPARRSIMSGRRTYPFRGWHPYRDLPPQPGWEPIGSDGKMWSEILRERGWTTGYITDNPHVLLPVHKRFRGKFDRVELVDGQVPPRRKPKRQVSQSELASVMPRDQLNTRAAPRMAAYLAMNPRDRPEEEYLAARVFRDGMGWIEWARNRQPFALVIDSFDAHEPWDAPTRLRDLYGPASLPLEPIQPFATPAAKYASIGLSQTILRRMRQLYSAEVSLVDVWLGHFLDRLANLGLADNTVVVLVSDHGVLLGEYGWVGKRYNEIHTELSHVPMLIRHPEGKAKGRSSSYWASTHDIGPTVLSTLGYDPPRRMNGADLSPLFDGKQPSQRRTYRTAAYNDHIAVRDGRWLLISDNQGASKRLYRLGNEGVNVAASSPSQVRRLWSYAERDAGPKGFPRFK